MSGVNDVLVAVNTSVEELISYLATSVTLH